MKRALLLLSVLFIASCDHPQVLKAGTRIDAFNDKNIGDGKFMIYEDDQLFSSPDKCLEKLDIRSQYKVEERGIPQARSLGDDLVASCYEEKNYYVMRVVKLNWKTK